MLKFIKKMKNKGIDTSDKNLRMHCRRLHRCTVPDGGINGLSSIERRQVVFSTQELLLLLRVGEN